MPTPLALTPRGTTATSAFSSAGEPWRIAFLITRSGDLGGAQVHVRDLSTALRDLGHEVVVLGGEEGILADQLRERDVPFHRVRNLVRHIHPLRDLRAAFEIRRLLRELSPDLVSTHSSKAGVLGRIAARSLGTPAVFTAHGWSFAEGMPSPRRRIYRYVERLAAPLADRIIAVSHRDRDLAISSGVGTPEQLRAVNNAMPDVPERLRADPARTPPRLIMVARFAPQKDHPTLLRALAEMAEMDWHLDLVGDGPRREEVVERVRELGLEDRVSFLGFRTDVPELLARSQVFLLITNWEGFPRSILEAMRAGLPVVASRAGGVAEGVTHDETGFLIESGDVESLASHLRHLITDPDLRVRLGETGRRRYEESFTLSRLVAETTEVYREVLADRKTP